MILSTNIEYFGQCRAILDFYGDLFKNAKVKMQNYKAPYRQIKTNLILNLIFA